MIIQNTNSTKNKLLTIINSQLYSNIFTKINQSIFNIVS